MTRAQIKRRKNYRRNVSVLSASEFTGIQFIIHNPYKCNTFLVLRKRQLENVTSTALKVYRLMTDGKQNFCRIIDSWGSAKCYVCFLLFVLPAPEEKAEPPQAMNALMRLNQLKPGLQYKLISQTGPVHVPVFTMAVEVDGTTFEASGPSKRTAKLHVAVKVSTGNILIWSNFLSL